MEITPLPLFVSRLNELTGEAVLPRVDGIRHRPVFTTANSGFAITLVPESDAGPHMAKLGEDRYFKRSGASLYRMEHFDLADMFGRRRRAKLSLTSRVSGNRSTVQIILGLRNHGRASARAPYVAFSCPPPFQRSQYGLDGNMNEGMRRLPFMANEFPCRYGEDTGFVIHPGIVHEVALLWLGLNPRQLPDQDVIIEFAVCAEDLPLERGNLKIPIEQLS